MSRMPREHWTKMAEACKSSGDQAGLALALKGLGQLDRDAGDRTAALLRYQEAEELERACGDARAMAHTLRHVADLLRQTGQPAQAETAIAEVLTVYRADPGTSPLELANTLRIQALITADLGGSASLFWREARDLYADAGIDAGVDECDRHLQALT